MGKLGSSCDPPSSCSVERLIYLRTDPVVWLVIYAVTFFFVIFQMSYRLKTGVMRPSSVPFRVFVMLSLWSFLRWTYYLIFVIHYRQEEPASLDLRAFVWWLNLFPADLLVFCFSAVSLTWVDIVNRLIVKNNLDPSLHRQFSGKLAIFFLIMNSLLITAELGAVISLRFLFHDFIFNAVWVATFDLSLICWAVIAIFYGRKLGSFFQNSESMKEQEKKMKRVLLTMSIIILIGVALITLFIALDLINNVVMNILHELGARILEYIGMMISLLVVKGPPLRDAFYWQNWMNYTSSSTNSNKLTPSPSEKKLTGETSEETELPKVEGEIV